MKLTLALLVSLLLSACASSVLVSRDSCKLIGSFDGDEILECRKVEVKK